MCKYGGRMIEGITNDGIGLVIGSIGVTLAIISLLKGQKLENKLKEKDKLKLLSKEIDVWIYEINDIVDEIKNPEFYEDLFFQLKLLSQEIVSKSFDTNRDIHSINTKIEISTNINNHEIMIQENKDTLMKYFKNDKCNINTFFIFDNNTYYANNFLFHSIRHILSHIHEVEAKFGEIVFEFKPELLMNLKNSTEEILDLIIDSCMSSSEIEIDVNLFDKTDEIGLWIYHQFIGTDKLAPHLDEFLKLKDDVEKFREILITTSYS